jgi:mannose-6-phosphate isomerase-like protein (cupin superfamily)
LDWKIAADAAAKKMPEIYFFINHFFNRYEPEKIFLGEEYARVVHGAHAIPLYYHPGFRSAWYQIKKGQKMNEPDDTNPFPQAVVILAGSGFAKIGQKTVQVQKNEVYYIPPYADHIFWTEEKEPLVLLWFAWGKGA